MRLRLRTKDSTYSIGSSVTKASPLFSLLTEVKAALKMTRETEFILKTGFPPKPIDLSDLELDLASLGINDGETLILEIQTGAQTTKPTVAVITTKPSAEISTKRQSTCQNQEAIKRQKEKDQPIKVSFGEIIARIQKDDNSCLFRSISYIFHHTASNHQSLRTICTTAIKADPVFFNDAVLGRKDYVSWISKANSWGGAIELLILSRHFKTQIVSIDVSTGRMDRFGEEHDQCCFVLYSGIHYDSISVSPSAGSPPEFDTTVFSLEMKEEVERGVFELSERWRKERRFVDLGSFTLRCGRCGVGLKGQKEAQGHAVETGHTQFTEY